MEYLSKRNKKYKVMIKNTTELLIKKSKVKSQKEKSNEWLTFWNWEDFTLNIIGDSLYKTDLEKQRWTMYRSSYWLKDINARFIKLKEPLLLKTNQGEGVYLYKETFAANRLMSDSFNGTANTLTKYFERLTAFARCFDNKSKGYLELSASIHKRCLISIATEIEMDAKLPDTVKQEILEHAKSLLPAT